MHLPLVYFVAGKSHLHLARRQELQITMSQWSNLICFLSYPRGSVEFSITYRPRIKTAEEAPPFLLMEESRAAARSRCVPV